jgi:ArsR family transcriptional regulator, arsenate/arsenite/antimonite-responsive transcriptional repressor
MATTEYELELETLLLRLKALADEKRLRIISMLTGGERCVCDLQDDLEAGQSLLSHHLRTLKEAGLVTDRRDGRWVHYALNREALAELEAFLRTARAADRPLPLPVVRCC